MTSFSNSAPNRAIIAALALLTFATPVAAQSLPEAIVTSRSQGDHYAWTWGKPAIAGTTVHLELVRAQVVIRTSPTRHVRLHAVSLGDPDQARVVELKIGRTPSGLRITDMFPPQSSGWFPNECLPPVGERGDFWRNTTHFRIVLSLPRNVEVTSHIMDGEVEDQRSGVPRVVAPARR